MSTAVLAKPDANKDKRRDDGGAPARRAMVRWSWRMFRREWRRQILVLALLSVAVAATTVGLAIVSSATQLGADPTFGTANAIITLPGADPELTADLAAARSRLGEIDVVTHQNIPVPGSVAAIDLRSENPHGPYAGVTVRLDAGHYPTGPDQVAVTSKAAQLFGLHLGSTWQEGGRTWQVVGLVENPLNLTDEFALLAPGQASAAASVSILADAKQQSLQSFRFPSGQGLGVDSRGTPNKAAVEALVLVLGTIGLLFVGLLAVAGFAVMAQRRLRAVGMLGSLGATDRHVRMVMLANGAVVGATAAAAGGGVGLAGWLAFAPSLQSIINRRIHRFDLPWWAIATTLVLALVTAVTAAWWPARAAARMPVVAALSGRPPRPQPAHRFAAAGGMLLAAGLVLLAFADQRRALFIITGVVVTVVGILLLAPLAISGLARAARRFPIAVRLAVRDLARYQARSGAALGAATLAIGIAATIAISAAAAQAPSPVGNLPTDQLVLYVGSPGTGPGYPIPVVTPGQMPALQNAANGLAGTLRAQTILPLEAAFNPAAGVQSPQSGPGGQSGGQITASLARVNVTGRGEEINAFVELYVATPALLAHFGIKPSQISPTADVITSRTDLAGLQIFLPILGAPGPQARGPGSPAGRTTSPVASVHPNIQVATQLPLYTSDPNALVTSHALQTLGLQALPAGWLIQTPQPLTAAQIDEARKVAASVGLSLETRSVPKSLAPLRNWSTAAGILVALGVLAMSVGLIRSETANDLRTLTATGASSTTRRALTGVTAGALALLGALLGTIGAYVALIAWHRNNLHPLTHVPVLNLVVIIAVLPLIATTGGWLLAGREPPALGRQPLE